MVQRELKTYHQIIRMKKCYDVAFYYDDTDTVAGAIYDFLSESPENCVRGSCVHMEFYHGDKIVNRIAVTTSSEIQAFEVSEHNLKIIMAQASFNSNSRSSEYSGYADSYYHSSYSGNSENSGYVRNSYSGGSSNNNNNNNNNNN